LTAQQLEKRDNLTVQMLSAKNRADAVNRQVAWDQEFKLLEAMNNNTLTFDMLGQADQVDPTTRRVMWNQYQEIQQQKVKDKTSFLEDGNPRVNADMTAKIDTKPENWDPDKIWAETKNGLGTKTAESLVTRWKSSQAAKDPVGKKYRDLLAKVYDSKLFGAKDDAATTNVYIRKTNDLEDWLTANPNATDVQAGEFFSRLISKDVKKTKLARLVGLTNYLSLGGLTYITVKDWLASKPNETQTQTAVPEPVQVQPTRYHNPKTGEIVEWDGSQWRKVE
jgi:hypothetical protein